MVHPRSAGSDFDPGPVTSARDLLHELRLLQLRVDYSLRELESRANKLDEVLPRSTVSEVLSGDQVPSRKFVVAFVRACGAGTASVERWVAVRTRVAVGDAREPTAEAFTDGRGADTQSSKFDDQFERPQPS